MANVDSPNGFRPVKYLSGANWNGQVRKYIVPAADATALFVGDLVKLSDDAAVDGYPAIEQAAAGDAVIGVVVGFEPVVTTFESGSSSGHGSVSLDVPYYRAASTKRIALVVDDPNVIFEAQEDSVGEDTALASVGLNINFIVGSGSTVTGASGMEIDSSTKATTATLPLKLMGFVQRANNEVGANARWLVKINNHQLGSHTGTAGV